MEYLFFTWVQCVRSLTWQASVAWSVKNENRNSSYIKGSNEGRYAQHRVWNIINSQELLSLLDRNICLVINFLPYPGFLQDGSHIILIYAPQVANKILVIKKKCSNKLIPLN